MKSLLGHLFKFEDCTKLKDKKLKIFILK